jgi:protein-tyrosine phosphatase
MQKVLFLCSGNYYRSRFAEHLFNFLVKERNLPWRADSRGLGVGLHPNPGAISPHTLKGLEERRMGLPGDERFPLPATEMDFLSSNRMIALDRTEHYRMMEIHFPHWLNRVEYWVIHDLDRFTSDEALPMIEKHVEQLVGSLSES